MIFNLFKSKPSLKELIPNGFVDIHSHILPGIDDGAKTEKESVELILKMKELGFSKIIGTPHTYPGLYENTNDSITKAFQKLRNNEIKNVKIGFASEYMIEKSLIDKAKNKSLLCIKDNFILIEMSFISSPIGLYEILYEIKVNGYTPILAHPERYLFLKSSLKEYFKLKKFGCLFQANLLSLTDYYGNIVTKNLDTLLNKGLIDFFGSDIHNINHINAFENKVKCRRIKEIKKIMQNNFQFK